VTTPNHREVCLRPEYARVYPELPPGEWIPSLEWAAEIVARAQRARLQGKFQRTFDSLHFEFRGGPAPRAPAERHLRTRAEDQ
jgi:hypothetical protein